MPYNSLRKRNIYDPKSSEPFALSRTKIDLFVKCPRCFYLDRRLGVSQPSMPAFSLNVAVDKLLKQEFDIHRAKNQQHPLQKKYKLKAKPVPHEMLDQWRHNFTGVRYIYRPANLLVYGAIDDLWIDSTGEYVVVDYKATSKQAAITEMQQIWGGGAQYMRQMEVYQWLLRRNGLKVSNTGYFVYCNGISDKQAFDSKLEFDITLIAYTGSDRWVPEVLKQIKKVLTSSRAPKAAAGCEFCQYRAAAEKMLKK